MIIAGQGPGLHHASWPLSGPGNIPNFPRIGGWACISGGAYAATRTTSDSLSWTKNVSMCHLPSVEPLVLYSENQSKPEKTEASPTPNAMPSGHLPCPCPVCRAGRPVQAKPVPTFRKLKRLESRNPEPILQEHPFQKESKRKKKRAGRPRSQRRALPKRSLCKNPATAFRARPSLRSPLIVRSCSSRQPTTWLTIPSHAPCTLSLVRAEHSP